MDIINRTKMKKESLLDSIVFINTILLFLLPAIFRFTDQPIEVQVAPVVLFAIPIAIVIYKKRLRAIEAERLEIVGKAEKLRPLLTKLERLKAISNVGSSLTYYEEFIKDRLAFLGWRKHFESQGKNLDDELNSFLYDLDHFIHEPSRQKKSELHQKFFFFYTLVSSFRHLYDDLLRMIELAGKDIPRDEIRKVEELQENCEDFLQSLRDLCDEDVDIGSFFKGRYALISRLKKAIKK